MKKIIAAILILSAALTFYASNPTDGKRATFVAVGDDLIHTSIYKGAWTGAEYDFSPLFSGVSDVIRRADLAFVNQETMLGESNFSGYPRFCSPLGIGSALVGAGFDVINIANNHSLDMGEEGFIYTNAVLSDMAECVIGGGGVKTVERNGIVIAFVSYTYATNYGLSPVVSRFDEARARTEMKEARRIADVVVVSMHWGVEYDTPRFVERFEPTAAQKDAAMLLCSLGADVIIGTHPHVIERAEWIESEGKRTLCAYSLGNFVSNMRYGATMLGGMLTLDFVKTDNGAKVENARIVPIVCHYNSEHRGHTVYLLKDYTDGLAARHGTQNEGNERPFCRRTLTEIYENNISPEFRADEY